MENKQILQLKKWQINPKWTLFLDRDGVINKKIDGDYVRNRQQFEILDGVKEALVVFRNFFRYIIIVTNQQGIGKGLFSEEDLKDIFSMMYDEFALAGIKIDSYYYCPHLKSEDCLCRKPKTGMANQAKADFPNIDFEHSIMVGDSLSDMAFGKALNMKTVFIDHHQEFILSSKDLKNIDLFFPGLKELGLSLQNILT